MPIDWNQLSLAVAQLLFGLAAAGAIGLVVLIVGSALVGRKKHDHGDEYCPSCHDQLYNGF